MLFLHFKKKNVGGLLTTACLFAKNSKFDMYRPNKGSVSRFIVIFSPTYDIRTQAKSRQRVSTKEVNVKSSRSSNVEAVIFFTRCLSWDASRLQKYRKMG